MLWQSLWGCLPRAPNMCYNQHSSILPVGVGALWLFNKDVLWGHLNEASLVVCEVIEYIVNTFTFLLSAVNTVVNLWSSDSMGDTVLDMCYI